MVLTPRARALLAAAAAGTLSGVALTTVLGPHGLAAGVAAGAAAAGAGHGVLERRLAAGRVGRDRLARRERSAGQRARALRGARAGADPAPVAALAVVAARAGAPRSACSASPPAPRCSPGASAGERRRGPPWERSATGGWRSPRRSAAVACCSASPRACKPRASWQASLTGAFHHALAPLWSDGRLVTAAVWAFAAVLLAVACPRAQPRAARGGCAGVGRIADSRRRVVAARAWRAAPTVSAGRRRAGRRCSPSPPPAVATAPTNRRTSRSMALPAPRRGPTAPAPMSVLRTLETQDRRPRRGCVRTRVPQRDHAGRAGPPARARDGSPPPELAVEHRRRQRVRRLALAGRSPPFRGDRGQPDRRARRAPARARAVGAPGAAVAPADRAAHRPAPVARRVRHRGQPGQRPGAAGRRAAAPPPSRRAVAVRGRRDPPAGLDRRRRAAASRSVRRAR